MIDQIQDRATALMSELCGGHPDAEPGEEEIRRYATTVEWMLHREFGVLVTAIFDRHSNPTFTLQERHNEQFRG